MNNPKVTIFWFRRDLRLEDNTGLTAALKSGYPVLPVFIFDTEIIDELDSDDHRITFIHDRLTALSKKLQTSSGSILCLKGSPLQVWKKLIAQFDVQCVYANEDYEPYAIQRDKAIRDLLQRSDIQLHLLKDQVIFAKGEVVKGDNTPYTVFTPYKNKWLQQFNKDQVDDQPSPVFSKIHDSSYPIPDLSELRFRRSSLRVIPYSLDQLDNYEKLRNYPALQQTSHLSVHLRFGTVSIRQIVRKVLHNPPFLSELIWREFFMQIIFHFPHVVDGNFRAKYDHIRWRNNKEEFEHWKEGMTGYPMVDAGMRELNATGYMHNRVRMVVAGFLCKHLLIDWRWGEAYFAKKLFDYELSSNNGNWQWAAGTGCDAAPYFRVFNPTEQIRKFDPNMEYIKKWVPEVNTPAYPEPIVEHKSARLRAIETYKAGIQDK